MIVLKVHTLRRQQPFSFCNPADTGRREMSTTPPLPDMRYSSGCPGSHVSPASMLDGGKEIIR